LNTINHKEIEKRKMSWGRNVRPGDAQKIGSSELRQGDQKKFLIRRGNGRKRT